MAKADHHGTLRGVEKNCVKLRGLPWSTTSEQVVEFFGPELQNEIVSQGVHMVQNSQVCGVGWGGGGGGGVVV